MYTIIDVNLSTTNIIPYTYRFSKDVIIAVQGRPQGGETGAFCPGPQPERGPRRPHEGPPEYLFKRSIYSNRAVRSKYSNRAVTVFFRGAVYQAYR